MWSNFLKNQLSCYHEILAFVNCPLRNRLNQYGKSLTWFCNWVTTPKKVHLTFLETGLRIVYNGSSYLAMATLTNYQVVKVFHIPKLWHLCHKFKLLYQENVWFCCHGSKKNIYIYILNNFFVMLSTPASIVSASFLKNVK